MENQVIVYADPDILKIVKSEGKGTIATMPNFRTNPNISAWIGDDRPIALEINYELVTSEIVEKLKEAGVIVQVQCLGKNDNPRTWDKIIDMGVDWIQTDFPENVIATYTWKLAGKNHPVLIAAHRGAKSLAPENTMTSYKKAIELGLDFIEIDVHQTQDGRLVSIHDSSLKRTTGLDKSIKDVNYKEIRNLSAGEWFGSVYKHERIPSVDEIFEMARGKVKFYVDFKDGKPEYLVDTIRRHNVLDDCIIYGDLRRLSEIKLLEPKAKVMPELNDPNQIDDLIKACQPYAFDTKWEILSKELISECHSKGIKVFSDAMGGHENIIDFYEAMEWGIDCIQTDEPIILFRAIELFLKDKSIK